MWVNYKLNVDFLKDISQYFIGEKDFASFCKKASAEDNTVRRIDEFDVTKWRTSFFSGLKEPLFCTI